MQRRSGLRRGGAIGVAEHGQQNVFEGAAATQDSRFHGAHTAFENFGDFLIAEAFEIAKDDRSAKHDRNML